VPGPEPAPRCHHAHQPLHALPVTPRPSFLSSNIIRRRAIERQFEMEFVDAAHQGQVVRPATAWGGRLPNAPGSTARIAGAPTNLCPAVQHRSAIGRAHRRLLAKNPFDRQLANLGVKLGRLALALSPSPKPLAPLANRLASCREPASSSINLVRMHAVLLASPEPSHPRVRLQRNLRLNAASNFLRDFVITRSIAATEQDASHLNGGLNPDPLQSAFLDRPEGRAQSPIHSRVERFILE